jgi:hypothetical protein
MKNIVKIEGHGVFQIRDSSEAPYLVRRGDSLKALFQPETEQWLPISYMRFLRS